jgi:hypothetical protein
VKQALLAQLKTQLNSAVQNGKLAQTMADQMYAKISSGIDTLVTNSRIHSK